MKKVSIAASLLLALSTQVSADPGQEGDQWGAGFVEYYSTDKENSGFPFYYNDGVGFGLEYGYRFKPEWAARLEFSHVNINAGPLGRDGSSNRVGADLLYFLPDDMFYIFGGVKHFNLTDDAMLLDLGIGKHWELTERFKLITEVAAYNDIDTDNKDIGVKVGLAYSFGDSSPAAPKDSDGDGVNDTLDRCPNTPRGVQVDGYGCEVEKAALVQTTDSDNDGVEDAKDQCPNTPMSDKVDEVGCSIFMEKEVSQTLKITFAQNSAVIVNHASDFEEFSEFMKRYPNTDTVIEGYASAPGEADYNMALSKKRADAVRKLLITKYGIDAARITTEGFGETNLLDTSNTAAAHAKNRRIVAKVSASKRVKVEK